MNEKTGKKGRWLTAMKKALNHESNKKNSQEKETEKSKKKWFNKKQQTGGSKTTALEAAPATTASPPQPLLSPAGTPLEPVKSNEVEIDQKEQKKHGYYVALGKAKVAEAEAAAAQAAAEVAAARAVAESANVTNTECHVDDKMQDETAAIKIQTAFRGYMARRTLRVIRGLMRFKEMMQGQAIERQTTNTLKSMQTLVRLQSLVRERKLRIAGENQVHLKQLQKKHTEKQAKEIEKSQQNVNNWDSSTNTKEEIDTKLQKKNEASIRRERTHAYAFTHQQPWKDTSRSANSLFMDPNGPYRGWSWLERWLAARPWEIATTPDNEFSSDDNSPLVHTPQNTTARLHISEKPSPTPVAKHLHSSTTGHMFNSTAPSNPVSSMSAAHNLRSPSSNVGPGGDDDTRSMLSVQSEQSRRSSVGESSVRGDDESLARPQVPSYMAPTQSAKSKSRNRNASPAKKRVSCPSSPARSRRSTSSIADANSLTEHD